MDRTEPFRRAAVAGINGAVESDNPDTERARLEAIHGQVFNTEEVQKIFSIEGFMAPFVTATEKATGKKVILEFQHMPRFYWRS